MSSFSPLRSISEEGRNRSSSSSSSTSQESDPPTPSSLSSSSSSGSSSSSLENSRKIIREYKSQIQQIKTLLGEHFIDPLDITNFKLGYIILIIHQNSKNSDDPLNLTLYPCDSTYEQVIELCDSDANDNGQPSLKKPKLASKNDRCSECKCLRKYHRSDTPSISCLIINGQIPKTDSNMITSGGYCLSCLEAGSLCWMKSHKIKPENSSIPKFACLISTNYSTPISTFNPPSQIIRLKIKSLNEEDILKYFPRRNERVFNSFGYVKNNVFHPRSEKDTEEMVSLYLKDIIESSQFGVDSLVVIHKLGEVLGFQGALYPDIFVLSKPTDEFTSIRSKEQPILVVEVKLSLSVEAQNLQPAFGQLLEYMLLVRATYGIVDIFGILTDYNHWYFCSLSHSKSYAESTTLNGKRDDIISQSLLLQNRSLLISDPILYSSQDLPKHIESFIIKGYKSRRESVRMNFKDLNTVPSIQITNGRISDISISEFPLKNHIEKNPEIKLNLFYKELPADCTLYTLHQFYRGYNGLASLMCYFENNDINLVVGKSFKVKYKGDEIAYDKGKTDQVKYIENEMKGWEAFGVQIQKFIVNKKQNEHHSNSYPTLETILILPFCFTPPDKKNVKLFCTDFSFLKNIKDFVSYLPEIITDSLKTFTKNLESSKKILSEEMNTLITKLIGKKIKYTDINIRHLGLMPNQDSEGNCIYEYVLIDHSMNETIVNIQSEEPKHNQRKSKKGSAQI